MSLPDTVRETLLKRMWRIADEINWLALGPTEKTQYYENWTKDPQIGGVLQRYMPIGQVRVYIKDSLVKDYPRARRENHEKPFRMLAIDGKADIARTFIKPHGRQLADGRIICWGRASNWKAILFAVFERSFATKGTKPHAAVLTESAGKFSDASARAIVIDAAKRLGIETLVWDS